MLKRPKITFRVWLFEIFIVILQYINITMGVSKTASFTNKQNQMASLMKALGHPARIAIIEYLLKVDSCICGDIVNELPLAQPTISQHLKELKNASIIKGNIEENSICYCLDKDAIKKMLNYFESISNKLVQKENGCC